jgi:hypothetical protein
MIAISGLSAHDCNISMQVQEEASDSSERLRGLMQRFGGKEGVATTSTKVPERITTPATVQRKPGERSMYYYLCSLDYHSLSLGLGLNITFSALPTQQSWVTHVVNKTKSVLVLFHGHT